MFDRLPTPYGLVRYGVAPDHQKIKSVTAVFDKIAAHPGFRFFGNVESGRHVTRRRPAALLPPGPRSRPGPRPTAAWAIPGEDLPGSHPATEFVAWYNGHPDYRGLPSSTSRRSGSPSSASATWRWTWRGSCAGSRRSWPGPTSPTTRSRRCGTSRVREVYLLGRRGPAQAAFTNPEVRELGELPGADVCAAARRGRARPAEPAPRSSGRRPATTQEGRDPPGVRAARRRRASRGG